MSGAVRARQRDARRAPPEPRALLRVHDRGLARGSPALWCAPSSSPRAPEAERERIRAHGGESSLAVSACRVPAAAIVPFVVGEADTAPRTRRAGRERRSRRPRGASPHGPGGHVAPAHRLPRDERARRGRAPGDAAGLGKAPKGQGRPRARGPPSAVRELPVVVTGTDTDVGKTVISALLVRALAQRGPARYWKPVQTGTDSDHAHGQATERGPRGRVPHAGLRVPAARLAARGRRSCRWRGRPGRRRSRLRRARGVAIRPSSSSRAGCWSR